MEAELRNLLVPQEACREETEGVAWMRTVQWLLAEQHSPSCSVVENSHSYSAVGHSQSCLAVGHSQNCSEVGHSQNCSVVGHSQSCSVEGHSQSCPAVEHCQSSVVGHSQSCSEVGHSQSCSGVEHFQRCSVVEKPLKCSAMKQSQNNSAEEWPQSCSVDECSLRCSAEGKVVVADEQLGLKLFDQELKAEVWRRGVTLVAERMGRRLGLWVELEMALTSSVVLLEGAEHGTVKELKSVNCQRPVNNRALNLADKFHVGKHCFDCYSVQSC